MKRLILVLFLLLAVIQTFSEYIDTSFVNSPSLEVRGLENVRSKGSDEVSHCSCISIFKCPRLFAIYSKGNHKANESEKKSVQDSYCGYKFGAPYVCCYKPQQSVGLRQRSVGLGESDGGKCGKNPLNISRPRISGGQNSSLGDWPWMAALYYYNKSFNTLSFKCSGSLIASNWVLTAAHCIPMTSEETLVFVRLGDLDINSSVDDGANPIEINIKRTIRHPKYQKLMNKSISNDIALLQLEEDAPFSDYIFPICLHSGKEYVTNETMYAMKKPVVAGWGHTSYGNRTTTHLLDVSLSIMLNKECNQKYEKQVRSGKVKLDETTLCTYAGDKDACQGDSGGPLMFIGMSPDRKFPVWSLGGIVSYGVQCADSYPGVYTKVAAFIDWINRTTGLKF